MSRQQWNKALLVLNVVCAAFNLMALIGGSTSFLTVIALIFNLVAVKVLLDAQSS